MDKNGKAGIISALGWALRAGYKSPAVGRQRVQARGAAQTYHRTWNPQS